MDNIETEPKKFKKERKISKENTKKYSGLASLSFLICALDKLGNIIYNALIGGFFGKIFTGYSSLQSKFSRGFCGYLLFGNHSVRRFFKKLRKYIATDIESGFFVTKGRKVIKYFCSVPLNFYGNFFLFFGIYTVVIYILKVLVPDLGYTDTGYLITGIAITVAALPMTFSRTPLSTAVNQSVIGNMVFSGAFGFTKEMFSCEESYKEKRGGFMLFFGLIAGVLTFFIAPWTILLAILAFVVVLLIAFSPEIGVLITIAVLPFLTFSSVPTVSLCLLITVTALFYIIKLVRGKRVFKLEISDTFVLFFGIAVILSGIFSAGGRDALNTSLAMSMLLLGYFLVVNLMRTERWVTRCVIALVASATVTALIGIFEYAFGEGNSNWLDLSLFSSIKLRVVSLFENPNMLAAFLTMAFPFALALLVLSKGFREKLLCCIVCIALTICVVFTWTRGAWLAIIVASIVFFGICYRKTFRTLGLALLSLPLLSIVLPEAVLSRLLSITNLADSSVSYRIYTWRGTLNAICDSLLGGIGFGNQAFRNIYPMYAYSGMESAEHSHSLFLQILFCMGLLGLIIFAISMFLNMQKSFEYIKHPESRSSAVFVASAVSAAVGALTMGIFDYIWYNYRIFYLFWVVIAIGAAFVRTGNNELYRKASIDEAINYN